MVVSYVRKAHLLKHVLAEFEFLHQALAAVLEVHAEQGLVTHLLLGCDQAGIQLRPGGGGGKRGEKSRGVGEQEREGKGGERERRGFRLHLHFQMILALRCEISRESSIYNRVK